LALIDPAVVPTASLFPVREEVEENAGGAKENSRGKENFFVDFFAG